MGDRGSMIRKMMGMEWDTRVGRAKSGGKERLEAGCDDVTNILQITKRMSEGLGNGLA